MHGLVTPTGLCGSEIGQETKREIGGEVLERVGGERVGGGFDKIHSCMKFTSNKVKTKTSDFSK